VTDKGCIIEKGPKVFFGLFFRRVQNPSHEQVKIIGSASWNDFEPHLEIVETSCDSVRLSVTNRAAKHDPRS
jgi:hypothetical protein